jgi:hypothetical protein
VFEMVDECRPGLEPVVQVTEVEVAAVTVQVILSIRIV